MHFWRKMSKSLEMSRAIVLFVLSCKKLDFLRDICDFDSYISYGGSLRAERPARRGFARSQGKTGLPAVLQYRLPGHFRPFCTI